MNRKIMIYDFNQQIEAVSIERNVLCEIQFRSLSLYSDPYNEVTLDVIFEGPNDVSLRVPAFWAGDDKWSVRFSADQIGKYRFKSACSNAKDKGLHGLSGELAIKPYTGENRLLQHGRIRVSENKRHFVHADGTPFFWLGDTWWMALTEQFSWPKDFIKLTTDRVKKGFNLIQVTAGLYPEMDFGDPRGKNEAGLPFEKNFSSINPEFYDYVDLKLHHLVESGLMPSIFGSWGYYLSKLGIKKTKQFWRYLIARYGAYPLVWSIAGEATMPYYLSETRKEDKVSQKKGWCEIASYVREIDPFKNLLSIHPDIEGNSPANARDLTSNSGLFDFEMLQTGHSGLDSLPNLISEITQAVSRKPKMPVVNSESNYEGMGGQCWQDIQRLSFYLSIFHGAIGYTYGANGIWQVNKKGQPYGPSPHGVSWGGNKLWKKDGVNWGRTPWEEAAQFPGGKQIGIGVQFLMTLPWWEFEEHQEWIKPQRNELNWRSIRSIGIPRKIRLIYIPKLWVPPILKKIEPDILYQAYYFDPVTGEKQKLGTVIADKDGNWQSPFPPEMHDWIILLEASVCTISIH